jgi:hypothetical protein
MRPIVLDGGAPAVSPAIFKRGVAGSCAVVMQLKSRGRLERCDELMHVCAERRTEPVAATAA